MPQLSQADRFPRSIQEPVFKSRHLYAGCRMVGNRMSPILIPEMFKLSGFDNVWRFFDTSSMVHLRSPLENIPDISKIPFPNRSLPKTFNPSSIGWFEADIRMSISRGLPSSPAQHQSLKRDCRGALELSRFAAVSKLISPVKWRNILIFRIVCELKNKELRHDCYPIKAFSSFPRTVSY